MQENPYRTDRGWKRLYQELDAFWIHDNDRRRPHALLSTPDPVTGVPNHSNGFFQSLPITDNPQYCKEAASDLIHLLHKHNLLLIQSVTLIVGPATGATKLAQNIAGLISEMRGRTCRWASPEKDESGGIRKMIFNDPEQTIRPGDRALVVEDVVTTRTSALLAEKATLDLGGHILPVTLALVNRSGETHLNSHLVLALVTERMATWNPGREKCPLCEMGSQAISPKRPPTNWELLNQDYSS